MEYMKSISEFTLKEMMNSDQKVILVDVRSPGEFNEQHIPNAINLTMEQLENGELNIDENVSVVTVCGKGGGRSESAANYIQSNYSNPVWFLEGGTFGWFEETLK